ncbi:MAG: type I-F CRISPR-associated protein Csy1 [Methylobacter sp.]|nr:type I-F CRISPR-associated protein Csy1 [Methylobacter sp.]
MIDKAINDFFQDRKAAWLKKTIKASMTEIEAKEKELECNQIFSLEQWLPNAAKRAGQISISTHPCTFSHPSSRKNKNGYASSVIAASERSSDGYLRNGNVEVDTDALGNAAALDVYKFLMLNMDDGQSLLSHIQQDSELAHNLLDIKTESYQILKTGFLAMIENDIGSAITSSKIKQVYFPVGDSYHQLSILSASGLMFELKKRIDSIRFSDGTKVARACEKANEMHECGYLQLPGLTTIGYGGTKTQNISVLNFQNRGKAHLLSSAPPKLYKRDVQFPSTEFFSQSINYYQCRDLFNALHELFLKHKNNWQIRAERDEYYQSILDRIIERMWLVRNVSETQYNPDTSRLNKTQKIWLCPEHINTRVDENEWLDDLCKSVASFMFHGYTKIVGKTAFMFSDEEYKYIHEQVVKNREALR